MIIDLRDRDRDMYFFACIINIFKQTFTKLHAVCWLPGSFSSISPVLFSGEMTCALNSESDCAGDWMACAWPWYDPHGRLVARHESQSVVTRVVVRTDSCGCLNSCGYLCSRGYLILVGSRTLVGTCASWVPDSSGCLNSCGYLCSVGTWFLWVPELLWVPVLRGYLILVGAWTLVGTCASVGTWFVWVPELLWMPAFLWAPEGTWFMWLPELLWVRVLGSCGYLNSCGYGYLVLVGTWTLVSAWLVSARTLVDASFSFFLSFFPPFFSLVF